MKPTEASGLSGIWLLVTILGAAGALAVAVWYPTSELIGELSKLVHVLDRSTEGIEISKES